METTASSRLVLDEVWVSNPGDYGFSVVDSEGNPLSISAVRLQGGRTVVIDMESAVPRGARLRYGIDNGTVQSGRTNGPRGNLRDSAGLSDVFDAGGGVLRPLHNWCVFFDKPVVL